MAESDRELNYEKIQQKHRNLIETMGQKGRDGGKEIQQKHTENQTEMNRHRIERAMKGTRRNKK